MFNLTSEIMNNKYSGNVSDFQPVVEDASRVVISYGLKELGDGKAEWYEIPFYKKQGKPSFDAAKKAIIADINAHTDEKIVNGFPWTILHGDHAGETVNVWLSEENQRNFSEAQRVAAMTDGANLPLQVKVSEGADGIPVYDSFETIQEITNFYLAGVQFINATLQAGWAEKDSIDWTPYEQALNPQPNQESSKKASTRKK
jgi:hypothetical protein